MTEQWYVVSRGGSIAAPTTATALGCRDRLMKEGTSYSATRLKDVYAIGAEQLARLVERGKMLKCPAPKDAEPIAKNTPEVAYGPWTINPETLDGQEVGELNALILHRDPDVEPFETREEAAAFLSQNFVGV